MSKENTCKRPSNHQIWVEHWRGHGPGPPRNWPREGGRKVAAPQLLPPGPRLLWRLHGGMQRQFMAVSLFSCANPTILLYK
jgi:hypothetical protein